MENFPTSDSFALHEDYSEAIMELENFLTEFPKRLSTKAHNDPERVLHRKYVELSTLTRRLDEKNQQLSLNCQQLMEKLRQVKEENIPSEERIKELGNKNMQLNQNLRKFEVKMKDMQKEQEEKEDKICNLQLLLERKEKKMKRIRTKDSSAVPSAEYEDLQRQCSDQLQIISELRQELSEKDYKIDRLARKMNKLENASILINESTDVSLLNEDLNKIKTEDDKKSSKERLEHEDRIATLCKENMELQRLLELLQNHVSEVKDPERAGKQREALEADLLLLQSNKNEMESKINQMEEHQKYLREENLQLQEDITALIEKSEDYQRKLVSAEENMVEKAVQLKCLTEELKEALDQNDLMEFKMTEIEERWDSYSTKAILDTSTKWKDDQILDVDDDEETEIEEAKVKKKRAGSKYTVDIVETKIALKELELNRCKLLTQSEKSTLQAVVLLLERMMEDASTSHYSNLELKAKLNELEYRLNDSRTNFVQSQEELGQLRREKLKAEEKELLSLGEQHTHSSGERSTFFGMEQSNLDVTSDAKKRIMELEMSNQLLTERLNRQQSKGNETISNDEIERLEQKVNRFKQADLKVSIMRQSNLQFFEHFKRHKEQTTVEQREGCLQCSDHFKDELQRLKEENEQLNNEIGLLRLHADETISMASDAMKQMNESTETPPKMYLISCMHHQPTPPTNRTNKTRVVEIGEVIPQPIVLSDVTCEPVHISEGFRDIIEPYDQWIPVEHIPTQLNKIQKVPAPVEEVLHVPKVTFSHDVQPEELIVPVEEENLQGAVNEEMLQDDNEFILNVMREYEDKLNDSVIFKPKHSKSSSSVTSSVFDKYLNETVNMESPRSSDAPLSSIASDRSECNLAKTLISISTQTEPSNAYTQRRDSDLSSGITSFNSGSQGITPLSHRSLENIDIDPTFLENLFVQVREIERQTMRTLPPLTTKPPPYRSPTLIKKELKSSKDNHPSGNEELPTDILELLNYGKKIIDETNSTVSENEARESSGQPCELCTSTVASSNIESKHDVILNELIQKSEEIRMNVNKAFDSMEELNVCGTYNSIANAQPQHSCSKQCFESTCIQLEDKDHIVPHCYDQLHSIQLNFPSVENTKERKDPQYCFCCCHDDKEDNIILNNQQINVRSKSVKTKLTVEEKDHINSSAESHCDHTSPDSLSAILKEVECRIAIADEQITGKKKPILPTLPCDQKKFIPLLSPSAKKSNPEKNQGSIACCVSLASSCDSSTELLGNYENRTLPCIPTNLFKVSVTDESHNLKLPCPISVQRTRGRGTDIKKLRRVSSLNETSKTQKNCPALRRLNSFTEGYSQPDSSLNTSIPMLHREIKFLRTQCDSLCQELVNKEPLQHEPDDKSDTDEALIIEKKDKEIQLKSESISQITQMLQKTRRELEMKVNESNRREKEIKQLKEEMKRITGEKKSLEHTNSEQQISLTKLEATDMRLRQMNKRCEQLQSDNRELVEKIKTIEISQKEFEVLEHNVYELEMQLRDMEDIELHRDELLGKLNQVKKQRDEFLVKGKLVEEERNEFVRSNKTLEQYLAEWKKKSIEFKQTNQALKERIMALERDKKELEAKIVEIQLERVSMQGTICKLEAEKDDVVQELREVVLERNSMEERLADIEDVLGDHDELEEGFHSLRLQLSELTRQRDDYEAMTMSYKKKVQLLKRTIRQKEDSILQLTHDIKTLKVAIDDFSPSELPALKSFDLSAQPQPRKGEEYSRFNPNDVESTSESFYDLVPVRSAKYAIPSDDSLTNEKYVMSAGKKTQYNLREPGRRYVALFDYDPTKSSTSDYPERELRLKEGDYITVYGEMDIDGNLDAEVNGMRGLVPGIYVEEATTDESSVDVRHAPHQRMRRERVQRISTSSREHSYIVLYDYDPYTMGTTDRPDLELSLRKGEVITVIGSMGPDGYYTAILPNGKRGLVPSNFVQVYHRHTHNRGHTYGHNRGHTHVRDSFAHPQIQSDEEHFQGLVEVDHIQGPPYAPRDLKVTRVVTRHAVLLSWILPIMDDEEHSNGSKVRGYRIWVNGKKKEDVNGASTNKALVDGVDLIGRIEFSIQTVSVDDLCSEKCHFAITGALSALTSKDESVVNSQGDTYVALYDYDPSKSSPNPNPSLELNFHEGDLMKVFDKSRNDGFFHAEMKGKRGLVPSNFIEFIKSESSSYQSRIKHSSHDESNTRRVQFTKR